MRAYTFFNKIQNSLLLSFIICSVLLSVAEILSLVAYRLSGEAAMLLNDFSSLFNRLTAYTACYFVIQYFTTDKRWLKSFWGALCLVVFLTAMGGDASFFVGACVGLICSLFFEKLDKYASFCLTIICALIFGILANRLTDVASGIQMNLAYAISNRGVATSILFGIVSTLLSLFGNTSFSDLFFYKSYGGTIIVNDEIITGLKDMVENGYSGEYISALMTGHYFLIFALVGIALSLADELKSSQRVTLIVVTACAVLSGNISLLLLFLFLESCHMLISALFISALSYLAAALLRICSAYLFSGGAVELVMNIDKPVYLIVGGVVFVAIGYFTAKYSCLKFGISDSLNTYIPSRLNRLVQSLGGILNIVKIDNDLVEIRNPKLVNNFEIDCEIKENIVKVNDEKIKELAEYIKN